MGPGGTGGHTTGNLNDCVPPTSMMQGQMSNGEIETRRLIHHWSFALSSCLLLLAACVWDALPLVSLSDSLVMMALWWCLWCKRRWTECGFMTDTLWHLRTWRAGCSDCACMSSGPINAHMQQQLSSQVQLANPASSFGSSGYSHSTPSSQGSMIQGPGPGSSSSSRSNLNMQSHQGEPGTDIIMMASLHCWTGFVRY